MRRKREAREGEARLERHIDAVANAAGLRVLRDLGDGGTSRVCLVVPLDADPYGPLEAARSALKVARFDSEDARPVLEQRVLASVRSPHIVALLRVPDPGTSTVVLEYLPGGTLAELLARREFVRVGEAVTILVSVLRALATLHAAGFAHGSLSASKVLFSAEGRPVLVGLSHAVPLEKASVASRADAGSGAADTEGFREIVRLLTQATGDAATVPRASRLTALTDATLPGATDAAGWERLEAEAFAVAPAEPVLLAPPSGRITPPSGASWDEHSARSRRPIDRTARSLIERVRASGITRFVREKRRLLVYSTGCVALAATVAIILLTDPHTAVQGPSISAPSSAPTGQRRDHPDQQGVAASPGPRSSAPTSPPETPEGGPSEPTVPDDPVDAGVQLLRTRWACFSAVAPARGCLDAVIQPGSPLEQTDAAELQSKASGSTARRGDYRDFDVSLIERTGDAALLALTPPAGEESTETHGQKRPASLLIVRGEAGWRLRELFED